MAHVNPASTDPVASLVVSTGTTEGHNQWHGRTALICENVRAHGATGNGTSDDSAAFQAAIDAAIAQGEGAEVFVPPGDYLVETGLDWTAANNQNIRIRGTGFGSHIINGTSEQTVLTLDQGSSNLQGLVVEGLYIDMNSLAGVAIDFVQGGQSAILRDLFIRGAGNTTTGPLIDLGTCTVVHLERIRIRGGNYAAAGIRFTGVNNSIHIDGADITGCVDAIDEEVNSLVNVSITNSRLDENSNFGINFTSCAALNLVIDGNRFESNASGGIYLQGFDSGDNRMHGVLVANNYFSGLDAGIIGVDCHRIKGLTLANNYFSGDSAATAFKFTAVTTQVRLFGNVNDSTNSISTSMTGYTVALAVNDFTVDQYSGKLALFGEIEIDGALNHDGSTVGFYGSVPVAQQTGVAVTAAGIHAALVNLGLITA